MFGIGKNTYKLEQEKQRKNLERMATRVSEARRWLSEFSELEPMWDFILGKRITHIVDKGRELEVMAEGDVSQMREKLRDRLNKTKETLHED